MELTKTVDMTDEELAAAKAAKPDKKRFEKVLTAAGPIILCNPSRAQDNAAKAAMGEGSIAQLSYGMEQLFLAMCVIPSTQDVIAMLEEFPALARDPNVIKAVNRLSGAAKDEYAKS